MQVPMVLFIQRTFKKDRQSGGFGHLLARIGKRRCRKQHADGEAGVRDEFRRPMAQHHAEQLAPWRLLQWRSEEHTSELQSLMRISYAVFCLKKKTNAV